MTIRKGILEYLKENYPSNKLSDLEEAALSVEAYMVEFVIEDIAKQHNLSR